MDFFKIEIEKYNIKCIESNVSIDFCYNSLMYLFEKYYNANATIKLLNKLDFKDAFKVKILLNKANFNSKEEEIRLANENLNKIRKELFDFLDTTKDPYFFILQPFYKFGSGINYNPIPYKKDVSSGLINLELATDYANYLINKKAYQNN